MSDEPCAIRHRNRPCRRCKPGATATRNAHVNAAIGDSSRIRDASGTHDEPPPSLYASWSKRELLDETEGRDLDVNARNTKAELVEALQLDDNGEP